MLRFYDAGAPWGINGSKQINEVEFSSSATCRKRCYSENGFSCKVTNKRQGGNGTIAGP